MMYTFLSEIKLDYLEGVSFNKTEVTFNHKTDHIYPGDIIEDGAHTFYAVPYTIAYVQKGMIALSDIDESVEKYLGRTVNPSGGYLMHYLSKSGRIVRDDENRIVETKIAWQIGDETDQGEIIVLGAEYAVVKNGSIKKTVYKSLLKNKELEINEYVLLNKAVKRYKSLLSEIKVNSGHKFNARLEKSFMNIFKKTFNIQPKKTTELPPEPNEKPIDDKQGQHSLQHINFDINSPTRKSYSYKGPQNQVYNSPHYLNEQGQKAIEPAHVKNIKVFTPGQGVMHQGQPHTIHQAGNQNMAIKDAAGNIKNVNKKELELNPNHSFDPLKEPIVKSFNMPEAGKFDFHRAQVPKGENKFLKDIKENQFIEFPESHPEADVYKKKFNSNIARVSRINPASGKMLLSSPITTKDYKLYTAESNHFNKASDKLQDEYTGIAKNVNVGNEASHEYLTSLKSQASTNSSSIAEEISKERDKLNTVKETFNSGQGRNLQELGEAVRKLKILDEYQGVKKVFPGNQQYITPGNPQHDKFIDKIKDVEAQGIKKTGEGSDYRVPFKHNLFDFDLTVNPISGNINSTIKNAQKFQIGKKESEVIHYNPLEHKVTVKVGDSDQHKIMSLDELKAIKGNDGGISGFAKNEHEFNNPIAGEKENYQKGSFQHKEFNSKVDELKNNPSYKHITQESGDMEHSFHHDRFGRFKLNYNEKSGQRKIEFTEPKEFKIGGSTFIPTYIDPFENKITFHAAGQSYKKKNTVADITDIENDIKTQERIKTQPRKSKISQAADESSTEKNLKVKEAAEKYKNKLFEDMHSTSKGAPYSKEESEAYLKEKNSGNNKSDINDESFKKYMDETHSGINENNPYSKISDMFDGDHEQLSKEFDKFSSNKKSRQENEQKKEEEKQKTTEERSKAIEQSHEFQQNKGYVENYKKLPYLNKKEHTIEGKSTKLRLKDAEYDNHPAKFHIVNLDDVISSHIPSMNDQPFQKNPAYPEGVQAKSYHENNETASAFRKMVHSVAKKFNPDEVINAGIQGNDNTPIADKKGIILGGNSRTMGSKLHDKAAVEQRRKEIIKRLDDFVDTKNPEEKQALIDKVNKNPNPFVLRVVDHDLSEGKKPEDINDNFKGYNRLSAILNSSQNADISNEDLKKTNIQKVSDLIPQIAGTIGSRNTTQIGGDDTGKIKKLLSGRFKEDQMAKYFQGNNLTDDGHSFLKGILSSNAIDNEKTRKTLEKHPLGNTIINNINNAPMWNQIQNITRQPSNKVYSLQKDLDKTIGELKNRSKNKKNSDIPESMFETPVRQRVLFDVLNDESGEKVNDFTEKYHNFINKQNKNEDTEALFAMGTPEEMVDRFYQKYEKDNPSALHLKKIKEATNNQAVSRLFKKKLQEPVPPREKPQPIDQEAKVKSDEEDKTLRNVNEKFKKMKNHEKRNLVYKVGNQIPYGDGKHFDKILNYSEGDNPDQWHVTVQKVDQDGIASDEPRTHSTEPKKEYVKKILTEKIKSGEIKIRNNKK